MKGRRRRRAPSAYCPGHGPVPHPRSRNMPRPSLARGRVKTRVQRPSPVRKPNLMRGPIPSLNQTVH